MVWQQRPGIRTEYIVCALGAAVLVPRCDVCIMGPTIPVTPTRKQVIAQAARLVAIHRALKEASADSMTRPLLLERLMVEVCAAQGWRDMILHSQADRFILADEPPADELTLYVHEDGTAHIFEGHVSKDAAKRLRASSRDFRGRSIHGIPDPDLLAQPHRWTGRSAHYLLGEYGDLEYWVGNAVNARKQHAAVQTSPPDRAMMLALVANHFWEDDAGPLAALAEEAHVEADRVTFFGKSLDRDKFNGLLVAGAFGRFDYQDEELGQCWCEPEGDPPTYAEVMSTVRLARETDAALTPPTIPLRVIQSRGVLSPMEAIVSYLGSLHGPRRGELARSLGVRPGEFRQYLSRARKKTGGE